MEPVSSSLRELGISLQALPDSPERSPEARQVAGQLESLCRRLYPCVFESGEGGHPAYTYDKPPITRTVTEPEIDDSALLVPFLGRRHLRLADQMLQQSTLYSQLSVVIMPLSVKNLEISYSAVGADRRDYAEYQELFRYNARFHQLVSSGNCVFLPRRYTLDDESASRWARLDYSAPLLQSPSALTYLPGNLPQISLGKSPYHDLLVYETLLLPYFPEASLQDVAAVARDETDSFILFNRYLTRQLARLNNSATSGDWVDVIDDIKVEVARLNIEAKKVARSRRLRNSQIAMFSISIGAIVGFRNAAFQDVAGILGSVNLFQLLQGEVQKRNNLDDLKTSDFFIPYVLSKK